MPTTTMPTAAGAAYGGADGERVNNNRNSCNSSLSKHLNCSVSTSTTLFRSNSTASSTCQSNYLRPTISNSTPISSNRAAFSRSGLSASFRSQFTHPVSSMETPSVNNISAASTPRPNSRQSTSTSPPGLTDNNAAVAVIPANNHANPEIGHYNQQSAANSPNNHQHSQLFEVPELDYPTFEKSDDVTDIELEVENQRLHVHRAMLVLVSPVFRAMLTGDFIEKNQNLIVLKDKKHDEFLEFLQSTYPPWKPVSKKNVRVLLRYADEYRVEGLLRRCEDFLLALKMARDTHDEHRLWAYVSNEPFCRVAELLGLATNFNLERLSQALVDYLSPRPLAWQQDGTEFFAYSGPELENRILNKALATALQLIERNRYCDTVKELLNGHKVYFDGQYQK